MTKLHDLVYNSFGVFASEIAVVYDDGDDFSVISYDTLRCQAEELKSEFCKLGVQDEVVGVLLNESSCLPAVLLGLLSNDCPFFPVSMSSKSYMEQALAAVGVSYVVVHQDFCQEMVLQLGPAQCEEKTSQVLQDFGLQLLRINVVSLKPGSFCLEHSKPVCDGLAYCITTSGTTSKPKVVRVPHACIVPNVVQLRQVFQLSPGDKVLMASPLTFDPSIIDIFCTFSAGACLVMVPSTVKQRPEKLLEIIHRRQEITFMQATPSLMRTLGPWRLQQTVLSKDSNLQLLALGGEEFPRASELGTWLGPGNKTSFYNLYGITEVSSWASCHKVDRDRLLQHNQPVPIGIALTETLIKLSPLPGEHVTPDDVTVPPGQKVGEIWIGSSTRVCIIDDEQEQKSDGQSDVVWRHTGDVGTKDSDGNIYCLGRLDSQIKRLGKRLNLSAVEQVIEELPEVRSCCAIYHGTTLAAFVILTQSLTRYETSSQDVTSRPVTSIPSAADKSQAQQEKSQGATGSVDWWTSQLTKLQAHARHALPAHAMPDLFVEVKDHFPLTLHGKLDRQELKKRLDTRERENNGVSVLALQHLWKDHLPNAARKLESCDNFLSVGGDSLSAVRLATNLQAISTLSMAEIYDILVNKDFHHLLTALNQQQYLNPNTLYESLDEEKWFPLDTSGSFKPGTRSGQTDIAIISPNLKGDFETRNNTNIGKSVNHGEVVQFTPKRNNASCSENNIDDSCENERKVKQRKICSCQDSNGAPKSIIQRGGRVIYPIDNLHAGDKDQCRKNLDSTTSENEISPGHSQLNLSQQPGKDMRLHLKWKFDTHKCVDASPLVIKFRNKSSVLIGSHSGLVSCLDINTGQCVWSVKLPDRVESSACSSLDGQYLVVGCYDGNIYTLCVGCGATAWIFPTGDSVKCSPVVNPVSGHVICGSHDGSLYCLDIHNQQCVWKCYIGAGSLFASPAIDLSGFCVYAATLGGRVLAGDAINGKVKWSSDVQKPVFSSPCCLDEGRLLFGCVDGKLYCVDTASGAPAWQFEAGAPVFSSPVVYKGRVLFGSHDFSVYCLSSDGGLLWSFKTSSTVYAMMFPFQVSSTNSMGSAITELKVSGNNTEIGKKTDGKDEDRLDREMESSWKGVSTLREPSVALEKGLQSPATDCAAVASTDGKLYILDIRTGHVLSEYNLPGQIFSSPVVSENLMIVGCRDNNVYCLEIT